MRLSWTRHSQVTGTVLSVSAGTLTTRLGHLATFLPLSVIRLSSEVSAVFAFVLAFEQAGSEVLATRQGVATRWERLLVHFLLLLRDAVGEFSTCENQNSPLVPHL